MTDTMAERPKNYEPKEIEPRWYAEWTARGYFHADAAAPKAPFSIVQLGARCEVRFAPQAPRNGAESAAAHDGGLDHFFHLWMLNRGVLITPFHNMALMCPATSEADVDLHTALFDGACGALFEG